MGAARQQSAKSLYPPQASLYQKCVLSAQMYNEGLALIKNAATQFPAKDCFENRTLIEDTLDIALQKGLTSKHVHLVSTPSYSQKSQKSPMS